MLLFPLTCVPDGLSLSVLVFSVAGGPVPGDVALPSLAEESRRLYLFPGIGPGCFGCYVTPETDSVFSLLASVGLTVRLFQVLPEVLHGFLLQRERS